jgi:two-component system phosphate regulon response regulator OmpR
MADDKTTVLYIDDDKSIHWIIEDALCALGMNVFLAYDTAAADAVLNKEKVDLIVCDLMMDKEDGLAYTRRIRAAGRRQPLLLLSGAIDPETTRRASDAGATACMSKPFEIGKLYHTLLDLAGKEAKI